MPKKTATLQYNHLHVKPLTNIKEIPQKERESWKDTKGQDSETECIWVNYLEKSRPKVFQVFGKSLEKKPIFAQNHFN